MPALAPSVAGVKGSAAGGSYEPFIDARMFCMRGPNPFQCCGAINISRSGSYAGFACASLVSEPCSTCIRKCVMWVRRSRNQGPIIHQSARARQQQPACGGFRRWFEYSRNDRPARPFALLDRSAAGICLRKSNTRPLLAWRRVPCEVSSMKPIG